MAMIDWAEKEVELYCKNTNEYDADCAKSALKAYKLLMNDGHSGCSWVATKYLLMRLMDGQPLSLITDDDFDGIESYCLCKGDVVSDKQCPRMSGLFRKEYKDGTVKYNDIHRTSFVDLHSDPDGEISCHSGIADDAVDELFPITLPYSGSKKYKVYGESFMSTNYNEVGSYDTEGLYYMITPDGEKIEINKFYKEGENWKMIEISKEEYEERLKNSKNKE